MTTPPIPKVGKVHFIYTYPKNCAPVGELFETEEEKFEICDATDKLFAGLGYLRKVEMDFCNGSVSFTIQSQEDPKCNDTLLLDVVAIKFFKDNKEYIKAINSHLSDKMESNVFTKDVRQISDIFYRTHDRYLKGHTDKDGLDGGVANRTIAFSKPGFKSFNYSHYQKATSLDILEGEAGKHFEKCIQTLPTSLLSSKRSKKAALFLQVGIDQKTDYKDKLLYLRQVLFLLTFQDAFKNLLQNMEQRQDREKLALYISSSSSHDISEYAKFAQERSELWKITLSGLPVNDIVLLIPLACRSSLHELSQDGDFLENGNSIGESYLARERNNARKADIAIRHLLENSFHITPKSFSIKDDDEGGIKSIKSYLMGVSGLAISPGLMGRLAMRFHHTVYYQHDLVMSIPHISDNFPVEFLLTAAQFYPGTNEDWIEEKCLGYIKEMMGKISSDELHDIKSTIQNVRMAVHGAPVETLLKQKSTDQYLVRNSAIEKLQSLYKVAREQSGLPPLHEATPSCSMM